MCGISSIYRYTKISHQDKQNLVRMNHEMHYRGPDGEGYWNDDICALAHTRLSIIGVDNGAQPLFNKDKSLVLVCNGEIYNYKELRKILAEKGYTCITDSDCEVILYLYEIYGADCLQHLRGMFAFCLYDTHNQRLFAARDRVGEKTLYYSQLPTGVVFSSELKTICKYFVPTLEINAHAFAESIRYNYPLEQKQTYIEQIKRLRAGEYAIVDANGLHMQTYWHQTHEPIFTGTREEAKEEVLRLMRSSVADCLQSDVPVAVLLSGGIDSSAIAHFAKETGKEIHVITAGYKGKFDVDERNVARHFAQEEGLVYHEIELDAGDFQRLFDEYTNYIDEPVCDVSAMSQYALYKRSREMGFKVLLSGIGGDELFYGYLRTNQVAESIAMAQQLRHIFPLRTWAQRMAYLKFFVQHLRFVLKGGYPYLSNSRNPVEWTQQDYERFARDAIVRMNDNEYALNNEDVHFSYPDDATLTTIYEGEFSRFMKNLCLYLSDRLGMANSVEIRSPFLDYRLVEFVSRLPEEMKYDGSPKSFYKECLKGIVPDNILYARKRGFEPPWLFINEMTKSYRYNHIKASHRFYNSMVADRVIDNLLPKV